MTRRYLIPLLLGLITAGLLVPVATRAALADVPLVLIHGHGASPEITWQSLIERLEGEGYRSGKTLFAIDLTQTAGEKQLLGLLSDSQYVVENLHRIRRQTGAYQFDLLGHSRGGLIVRMLTTGETAPLVRRAATLNTPHEGVLGTAELSSMLSLVGVDLRQLDGTEVHDLQVGSAALRTLYAREERFGNPTALTLAIGATWREELHPLLVGHDGIVAVQSQIAWPRARTMTVQLGPTPPELVDLLKSDLAPMLLVWNSPHLQIHESTEVTKILTSFFRAPRLRAFSRPCEPFCRDWDDLRGHWSEAELRPWLSEGFLPDHAGTNGERMLSPDRPITRAEFVYGLVRSVGLSEQLQPSSYADLYGHWSIGYVEAARMAGLLADTGTGMFEPDRPLTRAEVAVMLTRIKGLMPAGPVLSPFVDARGHWAEAEIAAAVGSGLVRGDERGFRPDDYVTIAEASVLLIRGFHR